MPSGDRRHSVSGDHHHHRHRSSRYDDDDDDYDNYDRDGAYPSRRRHDDDYDADPYRPRRAASRPSGMTSSRRHSPDYNPGYSTAPRGRRRHNNQDDDYDPRDKYYLSGEENAGFRSQSQPRPTNRDTREGDDYFGSRHHRSPSRREPSRQSRSRHGESRRHHADDDADDRHHHQPRGRRGAPPMARRQSSSAPPPSSRKYPPSASNNRHNRQRGGGSSSSSRYPPSSADNRKKSRSMSFGGGDSKSKDRRESAGRGRSGSKGGGGGDKGDGKGLGGAFGDVPWQAAARCALEAGTMAALRAHDKPGAWLGTKGAQVATAAVGAALVDGFIANRNPGIRGGKRHAVLRQVTNAALGNLVMNPAGSKVEQKKPEIHNAGKNFARHIPTPHHRHGR